MLVLSASLTQAQDVITTKDGTDIKAKIIEVTSNEVKYKKLSNPNGPLFTINKSEILIIRYENGENEVISQSRRDYNSSNNYDDYNSNRGGRRLNTNRTIHERMKYSQYSSIYNPSLYTPEFDDPYSPTGCGIASFFIPGLGQAIAGEWGRAACFFFGAGLPIAVLPLISEYESWSLYVGAGATLFIDIWNIVDAVRVAKIKNMFMQDIRILRSEMSFDMTPSLMMVPDLQNGWSAPVAGLSLNVRF